MAERARERAKELNPYFGAVYPGGRAEAEAIAHGIDEDEGDASSIGGLVRVIRVRDRENAVDLQPADTRLDASRYACAKASVEV